MKQLMIVIDIQQEYIAEGRPFYIKGIAPSLKNAKSLIEAAREKQIPVWHIKHYRDGGDIFAQESAFSDFIPGFEPAAGEKTFIKNRYSCFSSPAFAEQLNQMQPEEIVVIGYGSSMCCLCTIIDGIHRGFKFTLIEDATASRSFPYANENEMHRAAIQILRQYANIVNTKELMNKLSSHTTA